RREGIQLIDHRVDGVFELQDFTLDVDGDLFRQIAVSDRNRNVGNIAHLGGEIAGHHVDALGEVLPNTAHVTDLSLAAELAFGADFTSDAGDFGGKGIELVDHRVDRFFQLKDLATHVDGDFFRQVTVGHGDGDVGNIAYLGSEIAGHDIDALGQVFPNPAHVTDLSLAAELAVGADFAGDTGHFGGETAELIDHRIDGFLQLQNLATHVDG